MSLPYRSTAALGAAALLATLLAPATASASGAIVSPLVSKGVDPLIVLNMTSLISSELDFMGEYDTVDQLDEMPKGMGGACLAKPDCMGGIARANGADAMIGGAVAQVGNKFDLYLVLYDQGRIVRAKDFTIPNVPSVIADSMGGYVKELLTGESQADVAVAAAAEADDFGSIDEEDDFAMVAPVAGGSSRRVATPTGGGSDELDDFDLFEDEQAKKREAEAARRAEEARAAEEARRAEQARAADEARRAEEARRDREAAAAAAAASSQDDEEDFEDFDLSFGSAASSIVVQDDGSDDGAAASGSRYSAAGASSSAASSRSSRDDDDYDRPSRSSRSSGDADYDLDEERPSRSSRSSSSSSSNSARVKRDKPSSDSTASLVARVGASKFQDLSFVTYGAEAVFMPTSSIGIVAGIEAYSTKREIPEALLEEGQSTTQWNTILPFNVGAQYRFTGDTIRPYVGADLQFIPGYVKDAGGLAIGLRARGGADFMVAEKFGLNLNLSAGFWSGENFEAVQRDFGAAALVPQISAGTVFLF